MIWPSTYSKRTVCPECGARLRLEDVRFTPTFSCPVCEADIRISNGYRHARNWLSWALGLLIPYLIGARGWLLVLFCVPCTAVVGFLWAYAGKYLLPPKLVRALESDRFQGLGLGPR